MKTIKNFLLLALSLLIISCNVEEKRNAESITTKFMECYKSGNGEECVKLYPKLSSFTNLIQEKGFYEIASYKIINSRKIDDSLISVNIEANLIDNYGAAINDQKISFLFNIETLKEKGESSNISDSKGFFNFQNTTYYKFGKKFGIIKSNNISDIEMCKEIYKSAWCFNGEESVLLGMLTDCYLESKVSEYRDYYSNIWTAFVNIENTSQYSLENMRCKFIFFDRKNNIVYKKIEKLPKNTINPNELVSCKFINEVPQNVTKYRLKFIFDRENIANIIISSDIKQESIKTGMQSYKGYINMWNENNPGKEINYDFLAIDNNRFYVE